MRGFVGVIGPPGLQVGVLSLDVWPLVTPLLMP